MAQEPAPSLDVTIVGAGMFTNDLLLPVAYHLQRAGVVREIHVCATRSRSVQRLADNPVIREAFPGQTFTPHPSFDAPADQRQTSLYKDVLAAMAPRNAVVVAVPDQLHYPVVMEALRCDQHVLCVKPLVLKYEHARAIEQLAHERGLYVGVEYHKRFDRRSLLARKHYRRGEFGEFVIGEAKLIEPYYYRTSNFQNWFTTAQTDPFVYVGCHYTDLVYFITGLRPVEVSVRGVERAFPNGKVAYMWSVGTVVFENGALLSVTNGLGYPDAGAGSNEQCLSMYFEGDGRTGHLKHDDQFRGVQYAFLDAIGPGDSAFNYVNPDFLRLVPWAGPGYQPVGYGPDSATTHLKTIHRVERETGALPPAEALVKRREIIAEISDQGLLATPANSFCNELLMEAARLSITHAGQRVAIHYGEPPRVEPVSE